MRASRSSATPTSKPPAANSVAQHFLLILGLGATVWVLLLRFFYPGYLDPFVPFHIDHFEHLAYSDVGYGLMHYIREYPRPLGYVIFDLLGRLGTRGMLVPVFVLTLVNAAVLIRYIERLTGRFVSALTLICFFVLVFANPESYVSVKHDITAVVCLSCVLAVFHLWQNYVEAGRKWNITCIIALAFLSSYVKETYLATLVVFFLIQALVCAERRKAAFVLAAANVLIAGLSLAYNARRSPFVNLNLSPTDTYFQNWSPLSIWNSYQHLLKFLIFPVPALLVIAVLFTIGRRSRKEFGIGLVSLLLVATTLLPHTLLPNHLEDQYAWLGAFFFFGPILLADPLVPKRGVPFAVALLAAVAICGTTMREYILSIRVQGSASWLREQEGHLRVFLSSWPIMRNLSKPGEHQLVIGPNIPFQPFMMAGFIRKSFGSDTQWTVVLPDRFQTWKGLTTEVIHASDLTSLAYDHIFVFNPDAELTGVYSEEDAAAMLQGGGFTQFPALPREEQATSQPQPTPAGLVFRADPNPVPFKNPSGITTISWDTGSDVVANIYIGVGRHEKLFASGSKGSAVAPWIQSGRNEFRLCNRDDHKLIAKLAVTMLPSDAPRSSPAPTAVPAPNR